MTKAVDGVWTHDWPVTSQTGYPVCHPLAN